MDSETKGDIATFFHNVIERLETKPLADWFREDKTDWPAIIRGAADSSINDLVIGYVCGYLIGYAKKYVIDQKRNKKILKFLSETREKQTSTTEKKTTTKKIITNNVKLTEKEHAYIQGLLLPLIPRIREIVNKQNASSLLGI